MCGAGPTAQGAKPQPLFNTRIHGPHTCSDFICVYVCVVQQKLSPRCEQEGTEDLQYEQLGLLSLDFIYNV
jgi:hypothetical protein